MSPLSHSTPSRGNGNGRGASWKDLVNGGALQCVEAATLGMPFEVWKTRMGRFRSESSIEAFCNVYRRGGALAFWQGTSAKLIESASKGAVLLYTKELLLSAMTNAGWNETFAGCVAGAGGGVAQTVVMSPCTFVITSLVTGSSRDATISTIIRNTFRNNGLRGFYSGASAIAFRQATNWASRQGITEFVRGQMKKRARYRSGQGQCDNPKLTVRDEAIAGIMGGALSTWNQPFEVARITMQSTVNEGGPRRSLSMTLIHVIKTDGFFALYKGIIPRIGLGVWQTLFMVTGAKLLREHLSW